MRYTLLKHNQTATYISKHFPSVRIIGFSMFNHSHLIAEMLQAGAIGYLVKYADKKEILEAIHNVFERKHYYCKSTLIKLAKQAD